MADEAREQQAGQAATAARLACCEAALARVKDLAARWRAASPQNARWCWAAAAELEDAISGPI